MSWASVRYKIQLNSDKLLNLWSLKCIFKFKAYLTWYQSHADPVNQSPDWEREGKHKKTDSCVTVLFFPHKEQANRRRERSDQEKSSLVCCMPFYCLDWIGTRPVNVTWRPATWRLPTCSLLGFFLVAFALDVFRLRSFHQSAAGWRKNSLCSSF